MSESRVRDFIEQASQALQNGQPAQALELADQAASYEHDNSDVLLIRAIALSQMQRLEEATATFEQAQKILPESARIAYNFAVHLQANGQVARAREEAERALRFAPKHQGARQLLEMLAPEPAAPTAERANQTAPPIAAPPPIFYRQGYEPPEHSLQWVERMGDSWGIIGWVIFTLGLVISVAYYASSFQLVWTVISSNNVSPDQSPFLHASVLIQVLGLLNWVCLGATILWQIIDIIDRRGNWFWIVPTVISCCCALYWAMLGLYMALGRSKGMRQ